MRSNEEYYFNISIIGTLDETESQKSPFVDVPVDQIMKDYQHLKPTIKEGILHSVTPEAGYNRTACRSFVVKYRIFERRYKADENYEYNISGYEIAESVLPYVISMLDIKVSK